VVGKKDDDSADPFAVTLILLPLCVYLSRFLASIIITAMRT